MLTPREFAAGTYFVTNLTADHRRLFQQEGNCRLLLETLQHFRREGSIKLHAYVIMPDHVHMVVTPLGMPLERLMWLIKADFSDRLSSPGPVWQKGYTDHRIRDLDDYLVRVRYLHDKPVRSRLVEFAEDYPFSSAFGLDTVKKTSVPLVFNPMFCPEA